MPSTLKLSREYGDDLGVLFVEVQGTPADEAEAFAWDRKWMGTSAMWTNERPFRTDARGIPNFALLSAEGEVLLTGNPNSMHKQIEDALRAEIKKAQRAPEGTPSSLKKAWKSFGKGDLGKAIDEAERVAEREGSDAADAREASAFFSQRAEAELKRVRWMIDHGYLTRAEERLDQLARSLRGLESFEASLGDLRETLEGDELEDEHAAARAWSSLEGRLQQEGFDKKLLKQLERFVNKHEGTKVGERARRLLAMARRAT